MKFLALLALSFSASSAAAQIRTESPNPAPSPPPGDLYIPNSQDNLNAKQVRVSMFKFARCVAGRHPKESSEFVLDATGASWPAISKKIDDTCLLEAVDNPGEEIHLSSNSQDILFSLADALVQKKLADFDPSQIAMASKLPISDALSMVGECAVRGNPGGARDLLKARLNSKEEDAAVQTMMPAFASCLPKGAQVRFNIRSLRGTVAVNYYRLALAQKLARSGAAK
jgi:hypothetical protein